MKLLQEVGKNLQENKRFLVALQQDRLADDELDAGFDDDVVDEEFEEL